MKAIELLRAQFGDFVRLVEKRPSIQQIFAPLYHEDGDMMDLFLDLPKDAALLPESRIRLSDHGLTLMRLSYTFDLDTPNKEKIFQRILLENGVNEEDGELYMETRAESLYPAIMQFAQVIGKVCNMRLLTSERSESPEDLPGGRFPDSAGQSGGGDRGQRRQADLPAADYLRAGQCSIP